MNPFVNSCNCLNAAARFSPKEAMPMPLPTDDYSHTRNYSNSLDGEIGVLMVHEYPLRAQEHPLSSNTNPSFFLEHIFNPIFNENMVLKVHIEFKCGLLRELYKSSASLSFELDGHQWKSISYCFHNSPHSPRIGIPHFLSATLTFKSSIFVIGMKRFQVRYY